ncbi:tyrosine-protein phosphatase, partial [Dellaglioa algida]
MIDLHCHILPGCDDGAPTMADALAMARVAVDNGISHILVTPHHMDGKYTNHKADVIQRTAEFQAALDEAKIDLVVFPGQEAHINGDLMQAIKNDDVLFADETNRYLMLELPHGEVPEYTSQMIFELQAAGITPVIVHPERNHGIQKKHELL